MPGQVDLSIYQPQPQPAFNPLQTLSQLGQIQQQQQSIRASQALEQERQRAYDEAQRKQQEADTFNSIIGNPAITRDALIEQVRLKSPEHYLGVLKSFQDLDKSSEEYTKLKNESAEAAARAQEGMNKVIGVTANGIAAHGYAPAAFEAGLKELETKFPAFKPTADNYRQLALQGGPDWIREHVDGLRSMADRTAGAELPGKTADAALKQQVLDNSYGGMTAEQHSQEDTRWASNAVAQRNATTEEGRLRLERDKEKAAAELRAKGKPLTQGETDKISEVDRSLAAVNALEQTLDNGYVGFWANMEAQHVPGFMAGIVPGATGAKDTAAELAVAKQIIGRGVHGGVMRANDQLQADKYMPAQGDSKQLAKSKLAQLKTLLIQNRADHVNNLGKSGYDVSNFANIVRYDNNGQVIPEQ